MESPVIMVRHGGACLCGPARGGAARGGGGGGGGRCVVASGYVCAIEAISIVCSHQVNHHF